MANTTFGCVNAKGKRNAKTEPEQWKACRDQSGENNTCSVKTN